MNRNRPQLLERIVERGGPQTLGGVLAEERVNGTGELQEQLGDHKETGKKQDTARDQTSDRRSEAVALDIRHELLPVCNDDGNPFRSGEVARRRSISIAARASGDKS